MADEHNSNSTVILSAAVPKAAAALHQNALPIGTMMGEFEIIDLIGEGGFGIVYLAQDHSLHRKVALKEYMPASLAARAADSSVSVRSERQRETFGIGLRSFVNEARILAQFDHPALVKVYRFWEANGTAYMVMPFFSGRTLQDTLRERDQAPDEAWIRKVLSPVMDALEIIHNNQIYHRDIAPDNIMLLADDRAVLLDFGAARRVISDMTQALTVILKPGYAPIEQYAEMPGMKQGPWTDVYALAAVVYFMILNRKPPPAVGRIMQDSYEPLILSEMAGRYNDRFLQGIDKCLNVKAEDRPQSMAEMREAIGFGNNFGAQPGVVEPSIPSKPKKAKPAKPFPTVKPTPTVRHTIAAPAQTREDSDDESRTSKLPLILGGVVIAAALAGGYLYYTKYQAASVVASAAPAPIAQPARKPVAVPPSSRVASSAAAPLRFATLAEAIDGAQAASAVGLSLKVDAPSQLTVGSPLKLAAMAKSDGFLYVFVWDQTEDKIYRILPTNKDADNAIKANSQFMFSGSKSEASKFIAKEPVGNLRLMSMLSENPRDLSATHFSADGEMLSTDRIALEAQLNSAGLASLLGTPKCATAAGCADHFTINAMSITKIAAPPIIAPSLPKTVAPKPPAPPKSENKKTPDSEREYMKRLNKDLDNLLSK